MWSHGGDKPNAWTKLTAEYEPYASLWESDLYAIFNAVSQALAHTEGARTQRWLNIQIG